MRKNIILFMAALVLGSLVALGATLTGLMYDANGNCAQAVNFTKNVKLSHAVYLPKTATYFYGETSAVTLPEGKAISGDVTTGTEDTKFVTAKALRDSGATNVSLINAINSAVAGDILYRNETGWGILSKGAAGKVLKMDSGGNYPEWGTDLTE